MLKKLLSGFIACVMILCALPTGVAAASNTTTLQFEAGGGEGETFTIDVTEDNAGSLTFPKITFTKRGFEAKGWGHVSSYGSAPTYIAYKPGDRITKIRSQYLKYNGNTVRIAPVWAGAGIDVAFDDQNGTVTNRKLVVGQSMNYAYDSSKDNNAGKDGFDTYPERDGYNFDGWFTEKTGGKEIDYRYVFTADDAGITLYAHWSAKKTVTLDLNGGYVYDLGVKNYDDIEYELIDGKGIGVDAELPGRTVDNWNTKQDGTGRKYGDPDLDFAEITTLYAQYRQITRTIKYQMGGYGEPEIVQVISSNDESSTKIALDADIFEKNGFTKDGYDIVSFTCSEAYSGGRSQTRYPGDLYEIDFIARNEANAYAFRANWKLNVFGEAIAAIEKKLPKDHEITSTGSLGLPTADEGKYTIVYETSDADYLTADGEIVKLPETGVMEVTLTARITDVGTDRGTFRKDFTLRLFSEQSGETKAALTEAVEKIAGTTKWDDIWVGYEPAGTIQSVLQKRLADLGVADVNITVIEGNFKNGDVAKISDDGSIQYFFDNSLSNVNYGNTNIPGVKIAFEKDGAVVTVERGVYVDWDYDKLDDVIGAALGKIAVASETEVGEDLAALPSAAVFPEGTDGKCLSDVTWTSDNEAIKLGEKQDGGYPVEVTHGEKSVNVTLTASIKWTNPHAQYSDGIFRTEEIVTKTFKVKVVGTDPMQDDADYTAVDAAIAKIPADRENYTDESLENLDKAVAAVIRGLTKKDQAKVDAAAQAITDAINALEKKPPVVEYADYTAVDEAIAKAPKNRGKYTAESLKKLDDAIAAVVRGLTKDEQERVDAMAKAITDALDALVPEKGGEDAFPSIFITMVKEKLRPKTLTLIADGEILSETEYANDTEIDLTTLEAPEKEGFMFDGWFLDEELTEKAAEIKLDRDMKLFAGFSAVEGE